MKRLNLNELIEFRQDSKNSFIVFDSNQATAGAVLFRAWPGRCKMPQ